MCRYLSSKFKHVFIIFLLFGFWVSSAQAQNKKIDLRAGLGTALSPSGFLGAGSADYRLADCIAVMSVFQWSLGELQDIVFPSFGARLILPKEVLMPNTNGGIEFSALFSVGPVFREINGFKSTNMGYSTGLSADLYAGQGMSFGVTGLINMTSNAVESTYSSVYGHVGFHF